MPGGSSITITVEGVPNQIFLTVDGQEAVELLLGDEVRCCRSTHAVRLLRLRPNGLFSVLRSKLKWGVR
jgi:NAD+ kinase